jgi:hypothetical protein
VRNAAYSCREPALRGVAVSRQQTSHTGPSIVDSGFGLATLLLAGGMIAVGVATLRQPT